MFPVLKSALKVLADIPIASNVVPQTTTLSFPIAAGAKAKLRWWLPFSVGATGGAQFEVLAPAAPTYYLTSIVIHNAVAGTVPAQAVQTAPALLGNALANAGNHFVEIETLIENGVNAGTVDLQFRQNTSDALTLTVLKGGWLSVELYN